ncbi:hypothetical protein LCGC14_0860490 [marine sediment metagenome]|uniref:Uncharacterized protein n=1 Tax=marine sediment metagenome TaxID=412755 RepID=A0A0F9SEM4_9ZZZZ
MKIENYTIGDKILQIYSRLPYRLECKLEVLIMKMSQGMKGDPNDISTLKGFDISKKIDINDFLLINAILQPKIIDDDLNNAEHELNCKFRKIGNYLFEKYVKQYSEKILEKKKLMKSPISPQKVPIKNGLKPTQQNTGG